MPRGSAGIYSRPAGSVNPPVFGTPIDPIAFDAALTDIASELTNSLDRLGRGGMLAPLAMGGNAITNAGAPVAQTDVARLSDIYEYFPAGVYLPWAGGLVAPTGWLLCNGAAVSRTTYARLFTAIGVIWGVGDGSTTFNVPDLRGSVVRGLDSGKGLDPSRVNATFQDESFKSHTHVQNAHTHTDAGHFHTYNPPLGAAVASAGGAVIAGQSSASTGTGNAVISSTVAVNQSTGGTETRMKNVSSPYIIRT